MRSIAVVLGFILLPLGTAAAQQVPLQPGQRVRVTVPSFNVKKLEATVLQVRADTLYTAALVCPLADIERLEVVRGRKSFGMLKGAAIGAMVGIPVGAMLGGSMGCSFPLEKNECSEGEEALKAALRSGLVGALIGGLIGALLKRDDWREVPLDRVGVDVVARNDSFGIAARIAF
jgi:hypothetical protein